MVLYILLLGQSLAATSFEGYSLILLPRGGESMLDKALAALKTLAKAAAVLAVVAEAGIKVVSLLKG